MEVHGQYAISADVGIGRAHHSNTKAGIQTMGTINDSECGCDANRGCDAGKVLNASPRWTNHNIISIQAGAGSITLSDGEQPSRMCVRKML